MPERVKARNAEGEAVSRGSTRNEDGHGIGVLDF